MTLGRVLLLASLAALVAGTAACAPLAPHGAPGQSGIKLIFEVETEDAYGLPTIKKVGITITTFGEDGTIADRIDPATGENLPGKVVFESVQTPWSRPGRLLPGVVKASLSVDYFGFDGETVRCHIKSVDASGQATLVEEQEEQVKAARVGGGGFAKVSCLY